MENLLAARWRKAPSSRFKAVANPYGKCPSLIGSRLLEFRARSHDRLDPCGVSVLARMAQGPSTGSRAFFGVEARFISGRLDRHLHRIGIAPRCLRLVVTQRAHGAAPPSDYGGATFDSSGSSFLAYAFGTAPWICALGFRAFSQRTPTQKNWRPPCPSLFCGAAFHAFECALAHACLLRARLKLAGLAPSRAPVFSYDGTTFLVACRATMAFAPRCATLGSHSLLAGGGPSKHSAFGFFHILRSCPLSDLRRCAPHYGPFCD